MTADAESDPLSVSAVNGSAANVAHAVVGTYGMSAECDGSYTYTASKNFAPQEHQVVQDTFTYTCTDGHGGASTAALSITVLNLTKATSSARMGTTRWQQARQGRPRRGNGNDILHGGNGDADRRPRKRRTHWRQWRRHLRLRVTFRRGRGNRLTSGMDLIH